MATYLVLNALVLAVVLLGLKFGGAWHFDKAIGFTLVILLLTTAIFDTVLIHYGMFAYAPESILGVYVGKAPIEDFFYAVLGAIFVPMLWKKLGRNHGKS